MSKTLSDEFCRWIDSIDDNSDLTMEQLILMNEAWEARGMRLPDVRADGWDIDTSAGRPILVYDGCSVIEAEQAEYVMGLIRAHEKRQRQVADSPTSATTDPSGDQENHRDAVTTAALGLNAPLATPGAQSAPATHTPPCACRSYGPFCIRASAVEPFQCRGLPKQPPSRNSSET